MHDLTPITALGGTTPRVDQLAGLTCHEVTDFALASVMARRGYEADCDAKLSTLLGASPPGTGRAHLGQPFSAIWMGPGQWMFRADMAEHEDIASHLKTHLQGTASVTEQTDAWAGFDLSGSGILAVMELLCNVNMRGLKSGDATRTTIHHLGCFVICFDPEGFLRILGPRASAGSLHHAILAAMRSAL